MAAPQGISGGGNIVIKSGGTFSDSPGSQITATGGANGGNGGNVEVSAPNILSLNSSINASAQLGWTGGLFSLDPENIVLGPTPAGDSAGNGTVTAGSNPGTTVDVDVGTAFANINSPQSSWKPSGTSRSITGTTWDLSASTGKTTGQLTLEAGGNIVWKEQPLLDHG